MNNQVINFTDAKKLSEKAEKSLKKQLTERQLTEKQTEALVHELQVRQIELAMQNEELRKAYKTSEGYFSLDSEGTICDLNFTAADMLGEKRANLINSNLKLYVSDESKPVFGNFYRNVFKSSGKKSCEVSLGYDNKPLGRVYMEGLVTDEDQKCFIMGVDISKL